MLKWFRRKPPRPALSKIQLLISDLERIDPQEFKRVYSFDLSGIRVTTGFSDIQTTIQHLQIASRILKEPGKIIPKYPYLQPPVEVYLLDFFLTSQQRYLDEVVVGRRLLGEICNFLRTYEEIQSTPEPTITQDHNTAVLTQTVQHITALSEQLYKLFG